MILIADHALNDLHLLNLLLPGHSIVLIRLLRNRRELSSILWRVILSRHEVIIPNLILVLIILLFATAAIGSTLTSIGILATAFVPSFYKQKIRLDKETVFNRLKVTHTLRSK